MPLKNRNLLIVGIGWFVSTLIIVYVYSSFFYGPLRTEIVQAQTTVKDLKGKLAQAEDRARQLSKMQQEMAGLQVDVAQLEKQLPKDRELPALIRVLTHRAESYGLVLGTLTPGKAVQKELYDEIPYSVSVTSSFHSLGHFLTALGKGERLFAARNLALSPMSTKSDPSKTVNATFQLIAFKYRG
jgi:type IV pilus assembly protein PilO